MRVLFYVCMHNVLEFVANFVTFAILELLRVDGTRYPQVQMLES